jgi:hypothetical protein
LDCSTLFEIVRNNFGTVRDGLLHFPGVAGTDIFDMASASAGGAV